MGIKESYIERLRIDNHLQRNFRETSKFDLNNGFELLRSTNDRIWSMGLDVPRRNLPTLSLGGFKWNQPLYPGAPMELHFFEPRYVAMAREALKTDENRVFAFIARNMNTTQTKEEDKEKEKNSGLNTEVKSCLVGEMGTLFRIVEHSRGPEGTIFVAGFSGPRFRVCEESKQVFPGGEPLSVVNVEYFEDHPPSADADLKKMSETRDELFTLLSDQLFPLWPDLEQRIFQRFGLPPNDLEKLSFWFLTWSSLNAEDRWEPFRSLDTLGRLLRAKTSVLKMIEVIKAQNEEKDSDGKEKGQTKLGNEEKKLTQELQFDRRQLPKRQTNTKDEKEPDT